MSAQNAIEDDQGDERGPWQLAEGAEAAARPMLSQGLAPRVESTGMEASTFYLLGLLRSGGEEATPATRFSDLSPYTPPQRFRDMLAPATAAGLVEQLPGDTYRLTARGVAEVIELRREFSDRLRASCAMPEADLARMAELLGVVGSAAVQAPPPPEPRLSSWVLASMLGGGDPLLSSMELLSVISAYRGDCHRAAWEPSGMAAVAFEGLTVLWHKDPPTSFEALRERLEGPGHRRGHDLESYTSALYDLRRRGLVEGPDEAISITEAGRDFRDAVEEATDRYFSMPWQALSPPQKRELGSLLAAFRSSVIPSMGAAPA